MEKDYPHIYQGLWIVEDIKEYEMEFEQEKSYKKASNGNYIYMGFYMILKIVE